MEEEKSRTRKRKQEEMGRAYKHQRGTQPAEGEKKRNSELRAGA